VELKDELDSTIGRGWRKFLSLFIILIAIYMLFALVFSFWPLSSIRGVVKKVTSSEAIIQNYEWYYDQYNAIEAQRANIKALPDRTLEIAGMVMVLNNAIAEYNSRSKQITRNMWKANDLPYQITMEE
jgi:hypothetical protein